MDPTTEPTAQWDGVLRRHVDINIRSVNEEARSVDVTASSRALDSHNTILDQDWRLDRYRKNPVVLWNHNRFEHGPFSLGGGVRPEDFLPIGRAENVAVVNDELRATLVFAKAESNPLADRIYNLMRDKMLRSVSVGFRYGTITEEKLDGRDILRLGQNELYEISVVPVPSNPDAVAKSAAWEAEQLGRIAARAVNAGVGEKERTMPMTAEEKAAFDAALADAKDAKTVRERVAALETELKSERSATAKLEAELKKAAEARDAALSQVIDVEIDKLIGVERKFYPAEREEMTLLAREIGLERVRKMAAARPAHQLTEPVRAGGKELASANQPAAPPTEGARGDAGNDIVNTAHQAANAAA